MVQRASLAGSEYPEKLGVERLVLLKLHDGGSKPDRLSTREERFGNGEIGILLFALVGGVGGQPFMGKEPCLALFRGDTNGSDESGVKCGGKVVLSFQLQSDRFDEGFLWEGLDHPTSRSFHHGQKFARGEGLVVGKGDADGELIVGLMKFIEVHAAHTTTPCGPPA